MINHPLVNTTCSQMPPGANYAVASRAEALLCEQQDLLYCRTDRLFAGLMALQWLASLAAARWIAPRTWEGLSSRPHPHILIAFFLGGAISIFPIFCALYQPGRVLTRHVIAVGQLLMSGLLIHLTGGQLETHFHVFGSLAFLAFYRDWRVLVTASVVTALDHGLRGFLWPQSIFGVATVEPWRWLEHVGWVIFTDIFLVLSIIQSVREMRDIAWRQAKQEATEVALQMARDRLELRVEERTAELGHANVALERDIIERERAEIALRESEQRLARAQSVARLGYIEIDARTQKIHWSDETFRLLGYAPQEFEPTLNRFWSHLHPDDAVALPKAVDNLTTHCDASQMEYRIVRADGQIRWMHGQGESVFDADGQALRHVGTLVDITDRKRAETALSDSEQRLRLALESGGLGTWDLDVITDKYIHVSDSWKGLWGLAPEAEFSRMAFFEAIYADDQPLVREAFRQAQEHGRDYRVEFRCVWPDGSMHWLSGHGKPIRNGSGSVARMIGVTQEITERKHIEAEHEEALREAQERADRDPLTNLLNHRAFHIQFEQEAARAQHEGTALGVVMLDMDNFKFFNDAYGHATGDKVLHLVAAKLRSLCRSGDVLARFGGDEFALLLRDVEIPVAAEIEARLRINLSNLSFVADGKGQSLPITVSVGAATFPASSDDRLKVLRQADERLLRAKTGGAAETEAQHMRASALRHVEGYSMLDALVTAVDNKDRYTLRHSEDVMTYSLQIARELHLDEPTQNTVAVAALLHDVGKIGVPDAILRKPDRLTDNEFEAVKQHPQMGAIMVAAVPGLEDTLDAVRHHHERWDGQGYPFGLFEMETPLIARLMAVADAFSAMTTDRPYRKGMSRAKAFSILKAGAGTQWDPACVEAFERAQDTSQSFQPKARPTEGVFSLSENCSNKTVPLRLVG